MVLSRSSGSRLRQWALRAIAAFLAVYMLGSFGIPTLIPYIAVVLGVALDGLRLLKASRRAASQSAQRPELVRPQRETIH